MLCIVPLLRFSKQSLRSFKIPVVSPKLRSYHSTTIKIQVWYSVFYYISFVLYYCMTILFTLSFYFTYILLSTYYYPISHKLLLLIIPLRRSPRIFSTPSHVGILITSRMPVSLVSTSIAEMR